MIKYGILFNVNKVGSKAILYPKHIIKGMYIDDNLYDDYSNCYNMITNIKSLNKDNLFAFPITEIELQDYFQKEGFSEYEYIDLCAGLYQEICEKYIYIMERDDEGKSKCYVVNLDTGKRQRVIPNKNLVSQIKSTNNKKETVQSDFDCENIDDVSNDINNDSITIDTATLYKNVTKRVVGQDKAAHMLISIIAHNLKYSSYEGMKSNVLLYGPTGSGKTELIRSIANELDIPVVIEDMTNYTANGYVGDSVKKILKKLYYASGKDIEKAKHGIIMLDEFDKLASPSKSDTVNKTDVQQELLKIVEGGTFDINDTSKPGIVNEIDIDTSGITFIFAGAFMDLVDRPQHNAIGFMPDDKTNQISSSELNNSDFAKYGIISELLGRIPVKIPIKKLQIKDLERVLMKSSISGLKIYEQAFREVDNVHIVYADKNRFISKVAEKAYSKDAGARGIKSVLDEIFLSASEEIGRENRTFRELFVSSEMIEDQSKFVLKKVRRGQNELSERVREGNK